VTSPECRQWLGELGLVAGHGRVRRLAKRKEKEKRKKEKLNKNIKN